MSRYPRATAIWIEVRNSLIIRRAVFLIVLFYGFPWLARLMFLLILSLIPVTESHICPVDITRDMYAQVENAYMNGGVILADIEAIIGCTADPIPLPDGYKVTGHRWRDAEGDAISAYTDNGKVTRIGASGDMLVPRQKLTIP